MSECRLVISLQLVAWCFGAQPLHAVHGEAVGEVSLDVTQLGCVRHSFEKNQVGIVTDEPFSVSLCLLQT